MTQPPAFWPTFRSPLLPAPRVAVRIALLLWPALGKASAETLLPLGFQAEETVLALAALDGDTLALSDGRQLRLSAILAPKRPLGFDEGHPWPLEGVARAALGEFAVGQPLRLVFPGPRLERHGRLLAQVFDAEGTWLQAAVLAAGLARVASGADARAGIDRLLAAERVARARRQGLWQLPFYRVLTPEEAGARLGSFQIVEGRVLATAVVRGRAYLNFGADWREDFTVSLEPALLRLFECEGLEIDAYEGLRLRVRRWLAEIKGPMIEVTHPEHIEVIE